jgi:RNA polymerase sigma-70 factor (ECF subfamily)
LQLRWFAMEKRAPIETEAFPSTKAPHLTEADLPAMIRAAKAGKREALNDLLSHVRPRVLSVALRMVRDRDDAEDVAQEALIKVCRHLTRFEGRSAFSTWLHRIVVNTALDRLRAQQGRADRVAGDAGDDRPEVPLHPVVACDEETPEHLLGRAETGAAVQDAIACLSGPHQEVLALREIDGESYQTIAHIARVPVGTIMSRLHHARRRLAEQLSATFDASVLRAA